MSVSSGATYAPEPMPRPVVERLDAELRQVLADKEVQDQLAHWTALIKQAGIRQE